MSYVVFVTFFQCSKLFHFSIFIIYDVSKAFQVGFVIFYMFFTCFLDAVFYIDENFRKNSPKTQNFQKHHFGGLSPRGIVFRYIFDFRKKWKAGSVNYFDGDTFWVLLEVGKVLFIEVNGVGVGVGVPNVEVVCFFLL